MDHSDSNNRSKDCKFRVYSWPFKVPMVPVGVEVWTGVCIGNEPTAKMRESGRSQEHGTGWPFREWVP